MEVGSRAVFGTREMRVPEEDSEVLGVDYMDKGHFHG